MKPVLLFDHLNRSVSVGEHLIYTEDSSHEPSYDYADSLVRVDWVTSEKVAITTLIYNKITRGALFQDCIIDDIFSLTIFDIVENCDFIKVRLTDHYKMINQEDLSISNLENELKELRKGSG